MINICRPCNLKALTIDINMELRYSGTFYFNPINLIF